ncbi:MAG TPA: ATP-binding protein [Candidatus Acidoferrum sp.]|nr:ATP-binding protein [Candidatus Acidoferrum sp.]
MSLIASLLTSPEFMPHGFCYMWDRSLIWLHLISDGVIALAYFSIPLTLVYFVRKRRDLPFHWMFLMFGVFIVACGSTHVLEVWNLWHADYWVAGIIKAITAMASIITAILLFQLVPRALALPSPEALKEANQNLTDRSEELERRRTELARTNAELVAANKELETFSYSVSHDLRAPLRSIDGFSLALLEDYEGKLDAEGQDSLHRVRAATQRMGELIDDLLNLSRVTRAEMKLQDVDLSGICRAIGAELENSQPGRRIELQIQEGLKAQADSNLMRIALENLLGNAWKFSSKRESARIEFGQTNNNGSPVYFVRDNGAGFDSTRAKRLFGAFQRFHDKSEFPGTGVGLATVQRIIQRHGGRIWAESAMDRGATFYFTLLDAGRGEPESWRTR